MPSLEDLTFSRVSEYFLAELRKGTAQPIEEWAAAFPHLQAEIHEYFPSMAALERRPVDSELALPTGESQIGSCVIQSELGRGAMGAVYLAHQPKLDRQVALKVMALVGSDIQRAQERFEQECRAMARLDHPNIVPVYEFGCQDSRTYLVMKYIDGHSLEGLISEDADYRSKALLCDLHSDWGRFAWIGGQIAGALHHAHQRGIIHRDIKPANLILDQEGMPWITDFGIAKLHDQSLNTTRTGALVGTPRYMAPEQFRGACDCRSDVYSYGLTLYDLALGSFANEPMDPYEGQQGVNTGGLAPVHTINAEVPEDLSNIIAKACALAPEDRYQSAEELQSVLLRYSEGKYPAERRSAKRLSDPDYRLRTRRITLAVSATSVALVLAVAGWFALSWANRPARLQAKPQTEAKASPFLEKLSFPSAEGEDKSVIEAFVEELANTAMPKDHPVKPFEDASSAHAPEPGPPTAGQTAKALIAKADKLTPPKYQATKEKIVTQVEAAADAGDLDDLRVSDLVKAYRKTSLPAATRLMNRIGVIDRSGMSDLEKQTAKQIVTLYAKAVVNRHIPEKEANITIDVLTDGQAVSAKQLDRMHVPDRTLRNWLGMLQSRVRTLPKSVATEETRVEDELRSVIQKAMEARKAEGR